MAYNIDLKERSIRENEQVIVPFDKRINPNTGEADIDMLLFRDCMNEMKLVQTSKPLEDYFSDKEQIAEFACLFNKLQLAQSEGQGIPTIIRTMKEEGCPDPVFEIDADSITCILPAHPRHRHIREI
ncbi:MAG: hypothetical protein LBD52_08245 [Prevotellaceae bacterium]|jgi:predicted HTH transcriptional regulator|nr:hypothetical protein [Prevotellaceae bacterium]